MQRPRGVGDTLRPKRVAVIAYTDYETDGRVRRESEALAAAGYEVSAIAVGKGTKDRLAGRRDVSLYEIPIPIRRGGYLRYTYQYLMFFMLSGLLLLKLHLRERFDLVHVHSLPDFEVFSTLPLKIMHTPVILDLHEAMPETLAARFEVGPESFEFRLASRIEQASCRFADYVIAANDGVREAVVRRGTAPSHIVSIYNAPEPITGLPSRDEILEKYNLPNEALLVHAGGINAERDLETLLRATALLPTRLTCGIVLVGDGDPAFRSQLQALTHSLGLSDRVWFMGRLPMDQAVVLSSLSEVGVVTLASNPLTRLAWPSRIAEFVALGKPLVLPDLPFLRRVMGVAARYYTPGSPESLARELEGVMDSEPTSEAGTENPRARIHALDWQSMRDSFLEVCGSVLRS